MNVHKTDDVYHRAGCDLLFVMRMTDRLTDTQTDRWAMEPCIIASGTQPGWGRWQTRPSVRSSSCSVQCT